MTDSVGLVLPTVLRMVLRNFSLYSLEPLIEIPFSKSVFCLAGANGLGKSTFLATLNYALTGVVPDPRRAFQSAQEYYRYSIEFAGEYFRGRIKESDRETAEVEVELKTGKSIYTLSRGFFEPQELRSLRITDTNGVPTSAADSASWSAKKRNEYYMTQLAQEIGLDSFQQFVFLQHFVLTFDERRHLLFWDEKLLEQILYLTFGLNPAEAEEADVLERDVERAASRARNFNWQATELRKKLEDLNAAVRSKDSDDRDLLSEHKQLDKFAQESEKALDKIQSAADDVALRIAELSGTQASLRAQYDEDYSSRLKGKISVSANPVVAFSIDEGSCRICGSTGGSIAKNIQSKIDDGSCPLCANPIKSRGTSPAIEDLKKIDRQLIHIREKIEEALKQHARAKKDISDAELRFVGAKQAVAQFEKANAKALDRLLLNSAPGLKSTIQRYAEQVEDLLEKKAREYKKRDDHRQALISIQRKLVKKYDDAEAEFVPRFRELAELFLGLDLDVRLHTGTSHGVWLEVEVNSTTRKEFHELSESQRFFIDIALRMALIRHMSPSGGCLLMDTPEGSLDIAYENRAGQMFAKFATKGSTLIMTANINTSRLLLALAEKCREQHMVLQDMTPWSELSQVQLEEQYLFRSALAAIRKALVGKQN